MIASPTRALYSPPVRHEPTPKAMLIVVTTIAIAWVALKLLPVVLVLVVSLFLVGTFGPLVDWLEKKWWKRGLGIGVVFAALLIISLGLMALTIPSLVEQVLTLAKEEPEIRGKVADTLARVRPLAPFASQLRNFHYEVLVKSSAGTALEYSSRFAELVAYLVSAIFLALYIMIDRDRLRGGLFAIVPRTHHVRLSRVVLNLEVIVGGYIRGQALPSACMTIFTFMLLAACGVHNALAIAAFAGLADILPYIGVFLSIGPALAASMTQGIPTAIIVLVAMLAYEEFESRFLVPRIYGQALRLPSSIVLFALLAGGTLLGIIGALLALPVAAATLMLVEELRLELPGEDVEDTALRARDQRGEEEYERRAEGVPAEQAAAIAVEISQERRDKEGDELEAAEKPITDGNKT